MAVEVKLPPKTGELIGNEHIVGQAFDYAALLCALGNEHSFVVLTSYNKSYALWISNSDENDCSASNIAASCDRREGSLQFALKHLRTETSENGNTPSPLKYSDAENPSPPNLSADATGFTKNADRKMASFHVVPRIIWHADHNPSIFVCGLYSLQS